VDAPLQEEGPLFQESNGGLTLQQVIETAERKHPDLAVLRSEIGQANARVTEAGLLPDPEFIGRMESAPFRGETLRQAEYIAGLSQSFPTGNRIAARQQVEVLGRTKKRIDFESTRLAVRMRVQRAFSEALYWDRAAAAHARARSLQNELDLGIRQSHSKLARGVNAAGLLKENVLTDSIQLLKAAEDRYAAGDASMTDVLPVRRDAISLRLNYLDAIREVMEAWAELLPYL
jgi:outer membrane protein TolC